VFTAFSGSHQDAIRKGLLLKAPAGRGKFPYLPIDPKDIGRSYEPIIRVNSQSGREGLPFYGRVTMGFSFPGISDRSSAKIIQQLSRFQRKGSYVRHDLETFVPNT